MGTARTGWPGAAPAAPGPAPTPGLRGSLPGEVPWRPAGPSGAQARSALLVAWSRRWRSAASARAEAGGSGSTGESAPLCPDGPVRARISAIFRRSNAKRAARCSHRSWGGLNGPLLKLRPSLSVGTVVAGPVVLTPPPPTASLQLRRLRRGALLPRPSRLRRAAACRMRRTKAPVYPLSSAGRPAAVVCTKARARVARWRACLAGSAGSFRLLRPVVPSSAPLMAPVPSVRRVEPASQMGCPSVPISPAVGCSGAAAVPRCPLPSLRRALQRLLREGERLPPPVVASSDAPRAMPCSETASRSRSRALSRSRVTPKISGERGRPFGAPAAAGGSPLRRSLRVAGLGRSITVARCLGLDGQRSVVIAGGGSNRCSSSAIRAVSPRVAATAASRVRLTLVRVMTWPSGRRAAAVECPSRT